MHAEAEKNTKIVAKKNLLKRNVRYRVVDLEGDGEGEDVAVDFAAVDEVVVNADIADTLAAYAGVGVVDHQLCAVAEAVVAG